MTIAETIEEICGGLVSGISYIGSGLATGVKEFITSLLYTTSGDTTELSSFVVFVVVSASIALAVGITTKIFNWIQNLGA